MFGLRVSHGRVIGLEHTFAYSPNFIASDSKAVILNTNLILHAPLPRVRPYGTAGVGTVYIGGDSPTSFGGKFAINYGGGVKVNLVGPVGGRFDVRGYAIPGVEREGLSLRSQMLNVLEVTAGVVFTF